MRRRPIRRERTIIGSEGDGSSAGRVRIRPGDGPISPAAITRAAEVTYLAFRTAARGMAAEAQNQKEVLVKHGLVETVLDNLVQALDQFDAAMEKAAGGRQAHVGASAALKAVADEVVQIVNVMHGLNR